MPAEPYKASEELQAQVMTAIIDRPYEYHIRMLTSQSNVRPQTVFRAIAKLKDRDWLVTRKSAVYGAKNRPEHFAPSDAFWNATRLGISFTESLPPDDHWLYADAVTKYAVARTGPPEALDRKIALSDYMGRAAILGQSYNLENVVEWIGGEFGWRLLVAAHVALDAQPSVPPPKY